MATGKLIGSDDTTIDGSIAPEYFTLYKFTAVNTGLCSDFWIKCSGSGEIKAGIYDSDGGSEKPGTLLAKKDSGTTVSAGLNTITLESPCSIIKDHVYWLSINSSAAIAGYDLTTGPGIAFKAYTYSSFAFPSTCPDIDGAGWTRATNSVGIFAGWGVLVLSPSTIPSAEAVGQPQLNLSIKPATIQSQEAVGSPTITVAGVFIYPATIPSAEAVGTPELLYPQSIAPTTIPSAEVVGVPSIGVIGYILPVTIPSQEAVGRPTIIKYVWHVILDGQYLTETPETNRAFVIGRDDYGNPVWGEAHDSDESALVGERLDFQQELAIPTTSQAAAAAEAMLSKMRLTKQRGIILIPPNCGQELWDVVQITDSGANQSAVKFRVVGIRFEYQPRQAKYSHRLILGAP